MRPGKSLRSPRKNESARRDTRALQAGATELHRRPRTAARGGENGRTDWHWRGAERGKKVMSRQMFKIKQEIADHDRIALEVEWVGTLAVPLGSLPAGGQILLAN